MHTPKHEARSFNISSLLVNHLYRLPDHTRLRHVGNYHKEHKGHEEQVENEYTLHFFMYFVYFVVNKPLSGLYYAGAGAAAFGLLGHCIRYITPKTARPMRYIQKRFSWATPSKLAIASGRIKMKVAANSRGNS